MHIPVLILEVINGLNLSAKDWVIDCTFGDGGHTQELLNQVGEQGQVLAIDTDIKNIVAGKQKFENKNLILVNDNFVHLKEVAEKNNFKSVQGILLDLGWSTTQFEESGRGFSFLRDEPLDMRLGKQELTAAEILNQASEKELGRIFREYGEDRHWKKISQAIVVYRVKHPLQTSGQLANLIQTVLGGRHGKLHPATKVFQALRIAVNEELEILKQTLPQTLEVLAPTGRLAVITFHSLEDRIVKHFFQKESGKTIKIINKKPIVASAEELKNNPRSRSAKLRIVEKI
ncbi:MAG TPA: 16S rRNA (cytosine(1402)-N(4))-methyltransferase RsmH [Candidatus Magasanikbacteria bacterium]|nr:16S rRNA (cytosine(1402)-N(4))-methyltransferase RsmH [Candidatus Magasanikbacteria bacterium]